MKKIEKVRRTRAEWASLVEAFKRSGLERSEFAEQQRLHPRTFAWWASRLSSSSPSAAAKNRDREPTFVPVRVAPARSERPVALEHAEGRSMRGEVTLPLIEIVCGNGRIVRCHLEQVDDARLARVLALAEGRAAC